MADTFPMWSRQVAPEGQLDIPSGDHSLLGAFGTVLDKAGTFLNDTADRMAKTLLRRDQYQASDDLLKFSGAQDKRELEREQGAAIGAPGHTDAALQEFDRDAAAFLDAVPVSQKDYAREQVAQLRNGVQDKALRFEIQSRNAWDKQTAASMIDNGAAQLVNNPEKLPFVIDAITKSVQARHMAPQDEAVTLGAMNQTLTGAALGGRVLQDPRAALAEMKAGRWNAAGADALAQFEAQAQSRIAADDAAAAVKARQSRNDALAKFNGDYQNALMIAETNGTRTGPSDAEIRAQVPGAAGEAMVKAVNDAVAQGLARIKVAGTSHAEDEQHLQGATPPAPAQAAGAPVMSTQPAAGGQADSKRQQELQALSRAVLDKRGAFDGPDPAGAAVAYSPAVDGAWKQWQSAPQDPALFRQAVTQTRLEQERQNVPAAKQRVLPAAIATDMVQQVLALPTPEQQFQELQRMAGLADPGTLSTMLRELTGLPGGLPSGTDLALDAAAVDEGGKGGNPIAAARIYASLRNSAKLPDLSPEAQSAVLRELNLAIGGVIQGQAQATGRVVQARAQFDLIAGVVAKCTKVRIADGEDPNVAAREAVEDVGAGYGLLHDPGLAEIYFPKSMEAPRGAMAAGLEALRREAAGTIKPRVTDFKVAATRRDVADGATWVNGGAGFVLQPQAWTAPLPGRDGKPYFVTYRQAYDRGVRDLQAQRAALDAAMRAVPNAQPIGPSNAYDPFEDPYSGWFGNEPPAAP